MTSTNGSSAPTPAFAVRELSVAYGERLALDGVTLSVARNTVAGLLGPNGSGKSTLLSVVAGLRTAQSGEARIFGEAPEEACEALSKELLKAADGFDAGDDAIAVAFPDGLAGVTLTLERGDSVTYLAGQPGPRAEETAKRSHLQCRLDLERETGFESATYS